MARCCVVTGCAASNQDFGTFLFSIPRAEKLRQQWIDALGKPSSWTVPETAFICWSHFESKSIQQDASGFRRTPDAVPSQYLNNGRLDCNSDHYCRFCARSLFSELMGNRISDINRSDDAKKFLNLLLPESNGQCLSALACDECLRHIQLTVRFIRNCTKATTELEQIARICSERNLLLAKAEVKTELDEDGEIPLDSLYSEVKVEASSIGGISDREDHLSGSEDEDDIPLAVQFQKELQQNDLKCSYCSFSCAKRNQLASHLKKHRNELTPKNKPHQGKLSCSECDFICDKRNQLTSHRKKHKWVKQVRLDTGEKAQNTSVGNLNSEVSEENTSNNESPQILKCSECPYTCTRLIQLASHKKKHTGYQERRAHWEQKKVVGVKDIYECEFCDFKCKLRRQMAGHRASHSVLIRTSKQSGKERDHMCSICGKILSTRGAFFVHMKYHNDQRDFTCKICDKKFYSKRDVTMHVESLHEKKVYECEICGVKCTWKNALSKHMRKHDAKSYKLECSYCGKRFMAANELRLHVWRHTGQQLTCDLCGAGYRFNFLLTQHKIRVHGIQVEGVKLYDRFKKDRTRSKKRKPPKSNQASVDNAPTEAVPDTTASAEMHGQSEQPPALMENKTSSSSYSTDMSTGGYPHLMLQSTHVVTPGAGLHQPMSFHSMPSVMGQQMPAESPQNNIFHHVNNY